VLFYLAPARLTVTWWRSPNRLKAVAPVGHKSGLVERTLERWLITGIEPRRFLRTASRTLHDGAASLAAFNRGSSAGIVALLIRCFTGLVDL
jgi:hypothetical protein